MTGAPWIQTYTGRRFDLVNPDPATVDIEDIAHGLSNACRFAGQCNRFYSVAQHSSIMARYLVPGHMRLQTLLHDASEAYVHDVTRPLKTLLGEAYRAVERRVSRAIGERFGVDLIDLPEEIKAADSVMLATEQRDLMGPTPDLWTDLHGVEPSESFYLRPWTSARAEYDFLDMYRRISE